MESANEEFLYTYQRIKDLDHTVFEIVDEAIKLEEAEKPLEAIVKYKKSIDLIDGILQIQVTVPEDKESVKDKWNEACRIIHKLKRSRAELVQRTGILVQKYEPIPLDSPVELDVNIEPDGSPSRKKRFAVLTEDLKTDPQDGRPRTYSELAEELKRLQCPNEEDHKLELVFSCPGVRFYKIEPNGNVTTEDADCTMRILRLGKDELKKLNTTFFIQIIKSEIALDISQDSVDDESPETPPEIVEEASCCIEKQDKFDAQNQSSWIYPLIPCVSPCFRTEYGALIFPDLEAEEMGTCFGVMVPTEGEMDQLVLEILEGILHGVVMQVKEGHRRRHPRDLSASISSGLVRGANFIGRNLVRGAEKTGQFVSYSTPYIMSKMQKAPADVAPVSSKVQTAVGVASGVTSAAAGVTGYVAGKVGSATMSLGRFLAPHIERHGSTLLSKTFGVEEVAAKEKMQGVFTVAAGAVEGFGTVYTSLENSAKILGNNLSNNSVKIIEHKYGPSAGHVASETFDTVGNVINVSQNFSYFTPKGLVKKTAKNAGKAIIEDYRPKMDGSPYNIPASSLYPDFRGVDSKRLANEVD